MSAPIVVGTSGWDYRDWEERFHPAGEKDALGFYARYFDHVEIAASFANPPAERAAARWALAVADNPRFTFSAVAWRRFTHETERPYRAEDVARFSESLLPLVESGRLREVLFQFPRSLNRSF